MRVLKKNSVVQLRQKEYQGSDEELVVALIAGRREAGDQLYERYQSHVTRVLARIMGMDSELPDLVNEVFLQALKSIKSIKDPSKLKAWITQIAVFVARNCIRSRSRKWWISFKSPEELPPVHDTSSFDESSAELFKAVDAILKKMPTELRLVFSLRFFEEMEFQELADACDISLSTAKRRVKKCEISFKGMALNYPALVNRFENSSKWGRR